MSCQLKCRATSHGLLRRAIVYSSQQQHWSSDATVYPPNTSAKLKTIADVPGPKYGLATTLWKLLRRGGLLAGILQYDRDLQREFGKLVYKKFPSPQLLVCDPEAVAQILHAADQNQEFAYRPVYALMRRVLSEHNKVPGLFFSNGYDWYKLRKVISKKMLRPPSVAEFSAAIDAISSEAITTIKRERSSADTVHGFEVAELDKLLFRWSFESVASILFGRAFGTLGEHPQADALDFIGSVGAFLGGIIKTVFIPPWLIGIYKPKSYRDFEAAFLKMFHYSEYFACERIQQLQNGDITKDTHSSNSLLVYLLADKSLSMSDVYTAIVDVFLAGVDTTSNTMLWTLYNISRDPNVLACLYSEINEQLKGRETLSAEDIKRLPYLKAVVKETLRLHPVVPVQQRVVERDMVVMGYSVPAGTEFTLQTQVMGRMEDLFEEAHKFKPARWLQENSSHQYHAYSSLPFGHGTRMCVGRRVAELEIYMLLIKLLQNFELSYAPGETVNERCRGVTIPDGPLRVRFRDRPSAL